MIRTTVLGGGTVRISSGLEPGQRPSLAVVLCHGFGAPGDDLVPIEAELARALPEIAAHALFLFPEAPHELTDLGMPGARAWWPLDVEHLALAAAGHAVRDRSAERPAGLVSARRALERMLSALEASTGLGRGRIVLGGFSQGAMLATDVALHADEPCAGLAILSGTLLNEAEWARLAARRTGLPVFLSHGRRDPLLGFEQAEALASLLEEAGLGVERVPFDGAHTIPPEVLDRFARWLASVAGER